MSLFTSTAFYYSEQIAGGVVPGPPAFYSTSFATNMMTPFFAINDGGWDSSSEKWKQWGSISGSLPDNVGASSSLASGSGAITYDNSYKSYKKRWRKSWGTPFMSEKDYEGRPF